MQAVSQMKEYGANIAQAAGRLGADISNQTISIAKKSGSVAAKVLESTANIGKYTVGAGGGLLTGVLAFDTWCHLNGAKMAVHTLNPCKQAWPILMNYMGAIKEFKFNSEAIKCESVPEGFADYAFRTEALLLPCVAIATVASCVGLHVLAKHAGRWAQR